MIFSSLHQIHQIHQIRQVRQARQIRVLSGWRVAAVLLLLGCATTVRSPDWIDVHELAPGIETEIRYATPSNFVGDVIDGYHTPRCVLVEPAARALACVQRSLEPQGLGLRVYDCYRPQRAVDYFARWAEDLSDQRTKPTYYPHVDKTELFKDGYIARRSGHSRGSTVDLTLVAGGMPLEMATPFDFFDPASHTDSPSISDNARRNRTRLRVAMEACGFENLPEEWWHYTLRDEPYPDRYFDFPVE